MKKVYLLIFLGINYNFSSLRPQNKNDTNHAISLLQQKSDLNTLKKEFFNHFEIPCMSDPYFFHDLSSYRKKDLHNNKFKIFI